MEKCRWNGSEFVPCDRFDPAVDHSFVTDTIYCRGCNEDIRRSMMYVNKDPRMFAQKLTAHRIQKAIFKICNPDDYK